MKSLNNMVFLATLCAVFGLVSPSFAHEGESHDKGKGSTTELATIHGVISDSMCKFDHSAMVKSGKYGKNDAECIAKCAQQGMKLVLADKKNNATYSFVNPKEAKAFAGKKVAVTGHVDNASKVIHIHHISIDK